MWSVLPWLLACDPKAPAPIDHEPDADADGFAATLDCDDATAEVNPDAPEACNGVDDDCDGDIDEAGGSGFADEDGDGHGGEPTDRCDALPDTADCDDGDPDVHPGAIELGDDYVDSDCDGHDGVTCYTDQDGDSHGDAGVPVLGVEACPTGAVESFDDCDDADPDAFPGAPEVVNDSIDQDCDGVDDSICFTDLDGDGVGAGMSGPPCASADGDCEDNNAGIYPGAIDVPDDGMDNDCDGQASASCYVDADADRYGSTVSRIDPSGQCLNPGEVTKGGDCDDTDPYFSPGHWDYCDGGLDDDCNPATADSFLAVDGQFFQLLPEAIAAALPGSTVLACDGGYGDPIVVDKGLTLRSVNGAAVTALDVTAMGASAISVLDGAFTLEGFTVSWGEGTMSNGLRRGGGLYAIGDDDVTVTECVFQNNYAQAGGAIWFEPMSGSPALTLANTTLSFNYPDDFATPTTSLTWGATVDEVCTVTGCVP